MPRCPAEDSPRSLACENLDRVEEAQAPAPGELPTHHPHEFDDLEETAAQCQLLLLAPRLQRVRRSVGECAVDEIAREILARRPPSRTLRMDNLRFATVNPPPKPGRVPRPAGCPASLSSGGQAPRIVPVTKPLVVGLPPKSLSTLFRNRCPVSTGITVQFRPESVSSLLRNTQENSSAASSSAAPSYVPKATIICVQYVGIRAWRAGEENPRALYERSAASRPTHALRPRQLRDEVKSGGNQHTYIRAIHRRQSCPPRPESSILTETTSKSVIAT